MITFLNRNVFSPLLARRAGSRQFAYLKFLEKSQYDSPEVIRHRQWGRVKELVTHAYETVPYYRDLFRTIGLHPTDIRQLGDLEHLPVLTKAAIRQHGPALRSTMFADDSKLLRKTTSGSTGVPLVIYNDMPSVHWKAACTVRSDEWSGWRFGERVAKVWGNPEYLKHGLKGKLRNWLVERAIYLDTLDISDERLRHFVEQLRRWPPSLLFGHAHSLYLIACYCKKNSIDWIRPHGIISTAMLLHDWQRALIEKVFATRVTNRYGCEETSLIASECEHHSGLHLNADSLYGEVLNDRPHAADGTGSLVLTDMTNYAMPLIRYKVGDVVLGTPRSCPCGRGLPMIERIEGREADYVLTPAGKLISGISLTENFATLIKGAAQVQIVQESVTFLRVRMVRGDHFDDLSQRQIKELVNATFGGEMGYELDLVDSIPQEASGKYRFCISKVASDYLRALSA